MLKFFVEGSKENRYEIVLETQGTVVTLSCTCAAGLSGTLCKHRLALLAGDVSALLSNNEADVSRLRKTISGSAIERRFANICVLEREKEVLETRLKAEKKAMAREMGGAAPTRPA